VRIRQHSNAAYHIGMLPRLVTSQQIPCLRPHPPLVFLLLSVLVRPPRVFLLVSVCVCVCACACYQCICHACTNSRAGREGKTMDGSATYKHCYFGDDSNGHLACTICYCYFADDLVSILYALSLYAQWKFNRQQNSNAFMFCHGSGTLGTFTSAFDSAFECRTSLFRSH
jgi:hypothetical protein